MGGQLSAKLPEFLGRTVNSEPESLTSMAFGFGFNKQKVLSAAEKFVQQGKLDGAIAEYEKILKADPKDLTVMNTVGDLYARNGQNDKAVECFKSVGDAYAAQGFTVKAIAMYKKLTKLRLTLEGILRLAELYTQQGLFNDARAQYLQVAEEFLKAGELEQAVRIFQKTLEMDPENVAMRVRLAEVYVRLGKKAEAWQIFSAAADSLRARGALAQAEEILQRMLTLDPGNSAALLLRGRNAFEAGDYATAILNLEKVADLDNHPDGLSNLLHAYLEAGRLREAGTLAAKLATVHNDTGAIMGYANALVAAGQYEDAIEVYKEYSDRLLGADSAKVLETLHSLIGYVRDSTSSLETLLELFDKAGDQSHLTEVYELLAHAYVQSGELEKARDYYLKLTELEPENQLHAKSYQQVLARLGKSSATSHLITAEEGVVWVDELEATAPFLEQRYSDEDALAVRTALTDAELFISYNMPAKALGPLLSALPQTPRDLRLNQRLVALHTRAGRFAEAAVCCRTLESIYHDAGHPEISARYGDLASKYEERSCASPAEVGEMPAIEFEPKPPVEAEIPPAATPAIAEPEAQATGIFFHAPFASAHVAPPAEEEVPEYQVHPEPVAAESEFGQEAAAHEIDISEEWDGAFSVEAPVAAEQPEEPAEAEVHAEEAGTEESDADLIAQTVEEIRFYLAHSMAEQAQLVFIKLQYLKPDSALLSAIQEEIVAAMAQLPVPEAEAAEAIEPAEPEVEMEVAPPEPEPEPEPEPAPPPLPPPVVRKPERAVSPAPPPAPMPPVQAKRGVLDDLVSDLEASLGDDFVPAHKEHKPEPEPEHEPEPAQPTYAQTRTTVQQHAGVLGEFIADLENSLGESFLTEAPAPGSTLPAWPESAPARKSRSTPVQPEVAASAVSAPPPLPQPLPPAVSVPVAKATPVARPTAPEPVVAPPTFTHQATPPQPVAHAPHASAIDAEAGVNLNDMFDELKYELEEEKSVAEEDPETHYSLGVAFREMGLLDEAIGELQKVCQAVEKGHDFPQIMQTYTWLAQCFLDKGVPEAAIRWYSRALKLPNLDEDTRIALHYELASSYETMNDRPAAIEHFMEVYGSNIDYRDVSERIKALRT